MFKTFTLHIHLINAICCCCNYRTWWQVMGCTGVPLYKIYQRKTQWRTERPPEAPEAAESGLVRNDSVDDMIAQVLKKK